jgi:hypothetical protein
MMYEQVKVTGIPISLSTEEQNERGLFPSLVPASMSPFRKCTGVDIGSLFLHPA